MHFEYDYLVIGGGISGCLLARLLAQKGQPGPPLTLPKVALLESLDLVGGSNRPIQFGGRVIDNGLHLIPENSQSTQALEFVEFVLGKKLEVQVEDNQPLTFSQGLFKSFLGFGDDAPAFYEQIQYFLSDKRLTVSPPSHQWSSEILKDSGVQILDRSIVTQVVIENGKISHVLVNGAKPVTAKSYIYTGSLRDLVGLLPKDLFSSKQLHRILKGTYWSVLSMDLHHKSKITDQKNLFLLDGTTHDEVGPSVGRFLEMETTDESDQGQISQWLTFVNSEFTEDSEHVVHALKKMKRQIQRAFPDSLTELKGERIVLSPSMGGGSEYPINEKGQLNQIENLWISSAGAEKNINLLGALNQARVVSESLLGQTLPKNPPGFLVATELSV